MLIAADHHIISRRDPAPGLGRRVPAQAVGELSFTCQKIEWIWTAGGITAADHWNSPIA